MEEKWQEWQQNWLYKNLHTYSVLRDTQKKNINHSTLIFTLQGFSLKHHFFPFGKSLLLNTTIPFAIINIQYKKSHSKEMGFWVVDQNLFLQQLYMSLTHNALPHISCYWYHKGKTFQANHNLSFIILSRHNGDCY